MTKLLIFDLNGVLINKKGKNIKKLDNADIMIDYAFNNYNVGIWSSARKDTVNNILNEIFRKEQINNLLFIWSQEDCVPIKNTKNNYYPLFTKPLNKVWNKYIDYNESNTIIIDDTVEKLKNYENNHLTPNIFLKNIIS